MHLRRRRENLRRLSYFGRKFQFEENGWCLWVFGFRNPKTHTQKITCSTTKE